MKWRNHWEKVSLCIHPEGWHAWLDPGGEPLISSSLTFFHGNTSNGGMKSPTGLIQGTTVTRDPRSADWREVIWRLPFSANIFVRLCCTILMPVSSQFKVLQDYVEWCPLLVRRFKKTEILFQEWNPSLLRVKTFRGSNWNLRMTT